MFNFFNPANIYLWIHGHWIKHYQHYIETESNLFPIYRDMKREKCYPAMYQWAISFHFHNFVSFLTDQTPNIWHNPFVYSEAKINPGCSNNTHSGSSTALPGQELQRPSCSAAKVNIFGLPDCNTDIFT